MKKRFGLMIPVIVLMAALLLSGTASANSWGLKGKLLNSVMADHAWDDYSALSNQEGSFAVMKARYHHALFSADDLDRLHVYTAAVYQPDDKREAPSLMLMDEDLYLSYGKSEQSAAARRSWIKCQSYTPVPVDRSDCQSDKFRFISPEGLAKAGMEITNPEDGVRNVGLRILKESAREFNYQVGIVLTHGITREFRYQSVLGHNVLFIRM